jgi:putative ABC transport system permease protein
LRFGRERWKGKNVHELWRRIDAWLRRRSLDRDPAEELPFHLDMKARETGDRRAATRAVGNPLHWRERAREVWGWRWLDDVLWDVRYALRQFRHNRGFTTVAVMTLGLGIGATTAIYSLVDAILLQPLPISDADRLVRVVENAPSLVPGDPPVQRGVTYPDFLEWRARARTLRDVVAVWFNHGRILKTNDGAARLWGAMVSAETFTMLGARAMLGRTFNVGDAARPDVVMVSFDTWRRVFHSDPGVVGMPFEFGSDWDLSKPDRRLLTIVGVLPPAFEFPTGPFMSPTALDFYIPVVPEDISIRSPVITLMGRLGSGVSLTAARDEANVIGRAIRPPLAANAPAMKISRFDVEILKEQMVRRLRPALRAFLAAVAFVLLIVCANVANLLLARGTARQHEMALRMAIGARPGRIVRQVLTECLVLAACGGALGALFAAGGVMLVKDLASLDAPGIFQLKFPPSILPRVNEISVNGRMFAVAFGVAAITSVLFGILPSLHLSRTRQLNGSPSRVGFGRGTSRIRAALVVGQLVMATVLLVGAGLLTHSFVKLSSVENGYDPSNVLVFQLVFPTEYAIARKVDTIEAVLARLRAIPSVGAAGFTRAGFLTPEEMRVGTFVPQGRTLDEMRADPLSPRFLPVSEGYLRAMGVPLLAGRELEATDGASRTAVIVISRTAARQYFGTANPVGQFVGWHVETRPPLPVQVVGVVEDVRYDSPDREARPDIFVHYRQLLAFEQQWGDSPLRQAGATLGYLSFAVRTRGSPTSVFSAVGQVVRSVDPHAGIDAMIPMDRLVASAVAQPRFNAVMLGVFAGVAGVLAAIGIYGVLAYAVMQRTQEIGIRMALGAKRGQVLTLVIRQGAVLAAVGIGLGLAVAAAGARFLQGLLFGITPLDPKTFVAVSLLFGLVVMFASYVPARRATQVDPMVALRSE